MTCGHSFVLQGAITNISCVKCPRPPPFQAAGGQGGGTSPSTQPMSHLNCFGTSPFLSGPKRCVQAWTHSGSRGNPRALPQQRLCFLGPTCLAQEAVWAGCPTSAVTPGSPSESPPVLGPVFCSRHLKIINYSFRELYPVIDNGTW